MSSTVLLQTDIPTRPVRRGKVRDIYEIGDELLIVATDRISAFDVILPTGIPHKGAVLTQLSAFWFEQAAGRVRHHLIEVVSDSVPAGLEPYVDQLRARTMRCRRARVIPVECVVRGYLAGSGWGAYQQHGAVCGEALPAGLRQCDRLPEPIFTPTTKADAGHDEPLSYRQACELAGADLMARIRRDSVSLYVWAAEYALARGVILADTKLEWGLSPAGEPMLIDELFTPDSSRFWPADQFEPGRNQPSFDKQYVRDYLEASGWDKRPPAPALPAAVAEATSQRYLEAYKRLVGRHLPGTD